MNHTISVEPFFSIIIPVYNKINHVELMIDSVLAQTCSDYEIIVVDDGSTDGSGEKLLALAPHIVYQHQSNGGVGKARNTGVALARGKYIAFLDADDIWEPNKLEVQAEFLRNNPSVRWCGSNFQIVSEDGGSRIANRNDGAQWYIAKDWFEFNATKDMLLTSGVVVARSLLNTVGHFDNTIKSGQDVDLWIRIAHQEPICDIVISLYFVIDMYLNQFQDLR